MNKYQNWIDNYKGDVYRKCIEVTNKMQKYFPELRIVKGVVTIIEDGKDYQHQWLVDLDNNIVDPTAKQWVFIINYKEIKEEDPQITGKCINCGEWIYGRSGYIDLCSEDCYIQYTKYILKGI